MPLSVMTFIFLCFLGIVAIFFFAMRGLEKMHADMRDEHAQLRVMLRAMEARLSGSSGEVEARPAPEIRPTRETHGAAESRAEPAEPPQSLSLGPDDSGKQEKQPGGGLKINLD